MNGVNSYSLSYKESQSEAKKNKNILIKLFSAAAVIIVLALLLTGIFSLIGSGENSSNFVKHEIQKGESLWSIASQYSKDNIDLRRVIYEIKQINNISSALINPGRELIIPLD